MAASIRRPILLTWEDIDTEAANLPPDQAELLREIVATRRAPVASSPIGEDWYLAEVTVQGHIGIGNSPLSLAIPPTNGVTIVSARNGVGKTSVADALRHVLSGGQARSYELAEDNIHCADVAITATLTNGTRSTQAFCGRDRVVRWREQDGQEGDVPAEWIAAFERYRPVLLHPEISPVIEKPGELHEFLKGVLELTALEQLLYDLDQIRKQGQSVTKELRTVYDQAVRAAPDLSDEVLLAALKAVGPTPEKLVADSIRSTLERRPSTAPERVELAETWSVDQSVGSQVTDAINQLHASRTGVVRGAKAVQNALESLLGEEGGHLAHRRDQDVCPVCGTQGAGWVAIATAEATRLRDLLAEQSAAEKAVAQVLILLRDCLPGRLTEQARMVLTRLVDPEVSERIALWDRLSSDQEALSADTATAAHVEAMLADSEALVAWYRGVRSEIVDSHDESTGRRAIARNSALEWLDALEADRATLIRAELADQLSQKVTGWIKSTRDDIFDPIGKQIVEFFSALTCDVDLEMIDISLGGGVRQAKKVNIGLAAEGTRLPAHVARPTAVLSTGQRNALSLATYLPRATQPGSPYRFLVLDDPVHAFDSGRVRYLAGRLVALGDHYQIIVFSHDDRLWRELRASGAHATHLRLDRPPGLRSEVRVKEITRPSRQLLDDARTVLDQESKAAIGTASARAAFTLTMCRQAVDTEVATQLDILGRRLGMTEDQIRFDLAAAHKTRDQLDLLNRYAIAAGLSPVNYAPCNSLISELNAGAHGRAPASATLEKCHAWVNEASQLADAVSAVTG